MSDDFDLFRQQLSDIKPLEQDTAQPESKRNNFSDAQQARRLAAENHLIPQQDPLSLEQTKLLQPEDIVNYKKDGVQEGRFKKLRLGQYPIQAHLDLHQKRLEQARSDVINFIKQSQRLELRNVLIIHGKGANSSPPALLKSYVSGWLTELDAVLAIHSALPVDGGSGALYVLLKK